MPVPEARRRHLCEGGEGEEREDDERKPKGGCGRRRQTSWNWDRETAAREGSGRRVREAFELSYLCDERRGRRKGTAMSEDRLLKEEGRVAYPLKRALLTAPSTNTLSNRMHLLDLAIEGTSLVSSKRTMSERGRKAESKGGRTSRVMAKMLPTASLDQSSND
jgi:hypothetical protein